MNTTSRTRPAAPPAPKVGDMVVILETGEFGEVTSLHDEFEHGVFVTTKQHGTRMYAEREIEVRPEYTRPVEALDVAAYIEADAMQKRANEAICHPPGA